jgi:large subunit ribosomal protein L17
MRKQVFGRRLKRTKEQRKALFAGLISSMILKGKIKTTEEKAKGVRGQLEKLVTNAKKEKKRELIKKLKPFEVDQVRK